MAVCNTRSSEKHLSVFHFIVRRPSSLKSIHFDQAGLFKYDNELNIVSVKMPAVKGEGLSGSRPSVVFR